MSSATTSCACLASTMPAMRRASASRRAGPALCRAPRSRRYRPCSSMKLTIGVGDEVADRAPRRDPPADARRGDADLGHLHDLGPLAPAQALERGLRLVQRRSPAGRRSPVAPAPRRAAGRASSPGPPPRRLPSGRRARRWAAASLNSSRVRKVNDGPSRLVSTSEASSVGSVAAARRAIASRTSASRLRLDPLVRRLAGRHQQDVRSAPAGTPPPGRAPGARCAAG